MFCRRFAAADAIRNACAAVGVSGELEGREIEKTSANSFDSLDVSEMILRHRLRPLFDVREKRGAFDATAPPGSIPSNIWRTSHVIYL